MELEIQKQKAVPLLNRQRVSVMVSYDGGATPSVMQLKDLIASKMKVNKDFVAIRHVYQSYGRTTAKVIAHIYQNREDLLRLEKLRKAERKAEGEKPKAAEKKE